MSPTLRIALLQTDVTKDKVKNVENAIEKIREIVNSENPPKIVVLAEYFTVPCSIKLFRAFSETIPDGYTSVEFSKLSRELGIYIVAGSIPEVDEQDKMYNTSTVWNPTGELIAKYRKLHLFNVHVPNKDGEMIRINESDAITAGNEFATFQIDEFKFGLGICYDMRFGELARIYRNMGCNVLIFLGAFTTFTGPLHWELLTRARAVDNQCFVASASTARYQSMFPAWGHTMIVDPWGKIIDSVAESEASIVAEIDLSEVEKVRNQLPVGDQTRNDLYETILRQGGASLDKK